MTLNYDNDADDHNAEYQSSFGPQGDVSEFADLHDYTKSDYTKIVEALQNNYIFDIGFKTMHQFSESEKLCMCPCSKYMKPCRDRNDITYMSDPDNMKLYGLILKEVSVSNLIKHITEMSDKQGWYHSAILLYLYKECVPIIVNSNDHFLGHYAIRPGVDNSKMRKVIKAELKNK